MWPVTKPKRKRRKGDSMRQGELPFLWPDRNGSLHLDTQQRERSNVSQSRRSQPSPRGIVASASRLLPSLYFSSWLLSRNLVGVGFGMERFAPFEMWLYRALETSAFGCLTLREVYASAERDLGIERGDVVIQLIRLTHRNARFKSDGIVISIR